MLVVDFHNQLHDGDFAPDTRCYPSVAQLAQGIRQELNASWIARLAWKLLALRSAYRLTNYWPSKILSIGE